MPSKNRSMTIDPTELTEQEEAELCARVRALPHDESRDIYNEFWSDPCWSEDEVKHEQV